MHSSIHISAKKLIVLLSIVAFALSGVSFAALNYLNGSSANKQTIESNEFAADMVKIYGNGITFVSYERTVELSGNNTIQFYLPSGAITDTLTVKGISVVKMVTSQEYNPIIEKGDTITVYTENNVYTGKFLGWNDMLLLEYNNGTIMIPSSRITQLVLTEVVQTQGPKILVEVATDSPPGEYNLKISYLMRGPKWKPAYFVDIETSYLECWATLENVENWSNVTLTLVSGGPHLVYSGPIYDLYLGLPAAKSLSIDFALSTVDEYHEYTYDTKLSFGKDTFVKLPLFNGTISLRQEYFWSNGAVQNRYHINNTLAEPLAAGVIEFYRGEAWIGEDSIPYTPTKAESIAIANYAQDIKVSTNVTKAIDESHHQVRGTTITIENHKTTDIEILIEQDIGGYTLLASDPSATRVGGVLSWVINVGADSAATIYYEWEHYW